jgi:hypothetical protein
MTSSPDVTTNRDLSSRAREGWPIALGWGLVVVGALVLIQRYPSLPPLVPAYRWPVLRMIPRTPVAVGRIAAMGAGQVATATTMAFAARGSAGWQRLWRGVTLAGGAKTLAECIGLAQGDPRVDRAAFVATLLIVAGVAAFGLALRVKRRLGSHPRATPGVVLALSLSLALWAGGAALPRLLDLGPT